MVRSQKNKACNRLVIKKIGLTKRKSRCGIGKQVDDILFERRTKLRECQAFIRVRQVLKFIKSRFN